MENLSPDISALPVTAVAPKQLLEQHGKSFYWASLFLGSQLADSCAQLYQFCRFVDDLADGDLPNRAQSLADIRAYLDGSDSAVGNEVEVFMQLSKDNNIPLIAARELLDGMLKDQQPTAVNDEAELLRYCHAVAGTVGLMMCRILKCKEQRADSFAIDLGIAMQLTNISRDILEDAQMGRRYLPASWVDLSASVIADADVACQQQVADAAKRMLDLAEDYYQSALLGIQLLPFRSRLSITIALRVYRQIGWVLKRRGLPWWQGRAFVSTSEKILLSIRSLTNLIPMRVPAHNKVLHQYLDGLAGIQTE